MQEVNSQINSKDLAKKTQAILKELGYEMPIGHAYEFISKLAGFKSWNVASKSPNFSAGEILSSLGKNDDGNSLLSTKEKQLIYRIKEHYRRQDGNDRRTRVLQINDELWTSLYFAAVNGFYWVDGLKTTEEFASILGLPKDLLVDLLDHSRERHEYYQNIVKTN